MKDIARSAVISADGGYRYSLIRRWDAGTLLTFCMLNPSKADAHVDDPTVRRCMAFAQRNGAPGINVVNLFALRAADPRALKNALDPRGPDNLVVLDRAAGMAAKVGARIVCAWGSRPEAYRPGVEFVSRARRYGAALVCLGQTKDGAPRHPLFVHRQREFEDFAA